MSTIVEFPPFIAAQAVAKAIGRETHRDDGAAQARLGASATDDALVHAIGTGDRHAMRLLFWRHRTRVYRFILRMMRDRELAEDVVNEVFLDVWLRADLFAGRSTVSTWLLGIARHKALTALGRRRTEQLDDEVALAIPDPAPDPERKLMDNDRNAILRRSLDALTPEHREIIDLVYDQGMTVGEIAELLHIPLNTVKTRMFYARKRLAALVAAAEQQPVQA